WQRGTCKNCQARISPMYPVIELVTGILFLYSYFQIGFQTELITAFLFISLLVIITVSDVAYMLIPNKIILFFLLLLLISRIISPLTPWYDMFIGAVLVYTTLALINLLCSVRIDAG